MPIVVFLSTVSDEFRAYRDQLVHDLTRHNVAVKVQEDFKDLAGDTLDKLDAYIGHCNAVVHLVGDMCGAWTDERQQQALLTKHADLPSTLPPLGDALKSGVCLPYTQWEAWLALYHGKPLMIAKAAASAPRGPNYAPTDASRAGQAEHLERLKDYHRYSCEFVNPDDLAKHIAYSAILDLLVEDYAEKFVQQHDVAQGFIREMAKRVAGDAALDLDGMKRAVRNAIEIYEKEIAGRPVETNFDDIVNRALTRAKEQVDRGQSGLARATLRKAAEEMRREEMERREGYVASATALYHRERDIALAAYDGTAAADAIIELARSIHGANVAKIAEFLGSEAQALYEHGRDGGSNVHLSVAILLRHKLLTFAASVDERGTAQHNFGNALSTLGERLSGTSLLEEAVAAFRAALEERTRARVPLDWAATQNNLGNVLRILGERERGTEKLKQAVEAYRAALEEWRRERDPLQWAKIMNNLGNALERLGTRESGTARLEQAVHAYNLSLEERTRERLPLGWAGTNYNLGNALSALGERNSGTARLEEAIQAYRAALEERTQDRVPLDWARAQMGLGNALSSLGQREGGVGLFDDAIAAYREGLKEITRERMPLEWAAAQMNLGIALALRDGLEHGTEALLDASAAFRAALEEWTQQRSPLDWAAAQNNLGNALLRLGDRERETKRFDEAVVAYRAALEERTRERVPLDWATTQNNLGNAFAKAGELDSGTERLDEAVAAYGEALKERTRERIPFGWAASAGNQGVAMMLIAERTKNGALAETAVQQIEAALEAARSGGHAPMSKEFQAQLPKAQAIRDRLESK
jgi:tetratricopeptide (TPR) repeat protein